MKMPADSLPPTVLSDADNSLGFLVRHANRALIRSLNNKLAQYDISSSNWTALRALWKGDACTQVELAERLRIEKPSLTPVLTSLQKKGLVTLLRDEEDRRKTLVLLTRKGRKMEEVLLPFADIVNAEAASGFTRDEIRQLKDFLHRIIGNLG